MIFGVKTSSRFQLLADSHIQLAAGSIVRGDDESVPGGFDVTLGDRTNALFCIGNFLHTALLLEYVERGRDLACCQHLDDRFQNWVSLPNDVVQLRSPHSGFLKLLKGAARFDALMLTNIADQQHAVLGTK